MRKGRGALSAHTYATFKAMLRATETGKWLESHRGPDWMGFRPESFSIDGRMRGEVSAESKEEADALAEVCRKDGFVVSIVSRTYRHMPGGKDRQGWAVAFSRGTLP